MAPRRLFSSLFLVFLTALYATQGCADQGEGERCDKIAAGDDDCDDGLQCVPSGELTDPSTDRCCPPAGESFSDSRCARGGTLPTGDAGASGGATGSGGTGAGGTSGTGEGGAPEAGGTGGV